MNKNRDFWIYKGIYIQKKYRQYYMPSFDASEATLTEAKTFIDGILAKWKRLEKIYTPTIKYFKKDGTPDRRYNEGRYGWVQTKEEDVTEAA